MLIGDVPSDPAFASHLAAALSPGIRSFIGVPVVLSDGTFYGTLCAVDPEPRTLTRRHADLLVVLARFIATQIERDREMARRRDLERRLAEDHFRSLIRNASDIILVVDAGATIRFASPSVERILGYQYPELLGTSGVDLVHPDDLARVRSFYANVLGNPGITPSIELRLRQRDGTWRYIEAIGSNALEDPGVAGVIFNARDITERKEAEEALRRNEERFRSLVQNASDVIDIVATDGTILYISPSIEGVLGYRPEERIGRSAFDSAILSPDDSAKLRVLFTQLVKDPSATGSIEVRARHKDGSWRNLEGVFSNRADDPALGGIVVNYRDVTERKRAAEEVRRSEELDRLRLEFISSVSHELRTPLTAIQAGLGMLEVGAVNQLGPDERQLLGDARLNVQRLGRLIDDLLTLNQLEAGTLRLELQPLDLRTVALGAVPSVHALIQQKRQELEVDLPGPLQTEGDPGRLEQVVINLLVNAHRHTPSGTRIRISGRSTEGEVLLSVSDDGPGIPAQELEAVFERYHRIASVEAGSGLGLAIAKGIVELHGWRIWAESEPGQGVTFHVTLPHQESREGL